MDPVAEPGEADEVGEGDEDLPSAAGHPGLALGAAHRLLAEHRADVAAELVGAEGGEPGEEGLGGAGVAAADVELAVPGADEQTGGDPGDRPGDARQPLTGDPGDVDDVLGGHPGVEELGDRRGGGEVGAADLLHRGEPRGAAELVELRPGQPGALQEGGVAVGSAAPQGEVGEQEGEPVGLDGVEERLPGDALVEELTEQPPPRPPLGLGLGAGEERVVAAPPGDPPCRSGLCGHTPGIVGDGLRPRCHGEGGALEAGSPAATSRSGGTARRIRGKRSTRQPIAIRPSSRASGAPRQ